MAEIIKFNSQHHFLFTSSAPTGHTLRLLAFPETFGGMLDTMFQGPMAGMMEKMQAMLGGGQGGQEENMQQLSQTMKAVGEKFRNPVSILCCLIIKRQYILYTIWYTYVCNIVYSSMIWSFLKTTYYPLSRTGPLLFVFASPSFFPSTKLSVLFKVCFKPWSRGWGQKNTLLPKYDGPITFTTLELTRMEIDVHNVIVNQLLFKTFNCEQCVSRSKIQHKVGKVLL